MKRSSRSLFIASALAISLAGCAHSIHEVYVSDFAANATLASGHMVKVETEQFVVLGFTQQTDYVDQAYSKLMNECPSGEITGITTEYSTSLGFFSWTNKILMQGLCLSAKGRM